MNSGLKQFHLHLVSDATGETINSVARACVAQFDQVQPIEHFWNLVRTTRQLEMVIEGIKDNPGLVMFTLVDEKLRRRLQETCRELQVPCIPVLDPLINALAAYLGLESQSQPGRQHMLDAEYFGRMDAMDFALAHDDGQSTWDLHEADVILMGVSRTSKTPTCIYLANRGIKAANVPFVPGCPLPPELEQITRPLVVGLTKDPDRLIQIRRNRLKLLNQTEDTNYVDPEVVRQEVGRGPPALFPPRLVGDRRHPPLDRGNRRRDHDAARPPSGRFAGRPRRRPRGDLAMMLTDRPVVLASASAARKAMLERAGVSVVAQAAAVDEEEIKHSFRAAGLQADEVSEALGELKAKRVASRHPGHLVLGADQMLDCDGEWFDKPADRAEAKRHLQLLRGRSHKLVSTVVAVMNGQRQWHHTDTATLTMRNLSDDFIDRYLDAMGDAVLSSVGAYQLEGLGAQLFNRIEGDYFTILGMPSAAGAGLFAIEAHPGIMISDGEGEDRGRHGLAGRPFPLAPAPWLVARTIRHRRRLYPAGGPARPGDRRDPRLAGPGPAGRQRHRSPQGSGPPGLRPGRSCRPGASAPSIRWWSPRTARSRAATPTPSASWRA